MDTAPATTKTEADLVNMRVLLHLIEHAPLLAIEFANVIPRYTSLIGMVRGYNRRFVHMLPTDELLPGLIEEAQEWLAQP
jgi:hypothetical protein